MRVYFLPGVMLVALLAGCSGESVSESANVVVSEPAQEASKSVEGTLPVGEPPATVAENGGSPEPVSEQKEEAPTSSQDERYRQLVLGTWEDDFEGHRTMTLNEDGSGTMIVELSGMKATLFAARLEFNMQWTLQNGRLQKRTIDGKPARRVSMILQMMGDRVDEPILELTEDRLLLLDKDGETRYDWRRKQREPAATE